jgi:hypothetical protein
MIDSHLGQLAPCHSRVSKKLRSLLIQTSLTSPTNIRYISMTHAYTVRAISQLKSGLDITFSKLLEHLTKILPNACVLVDRLKATA